MTKLYVYDNELLGDNGDDFSDSSCVDEINKPTAEECLEYAQANYDQNSYTWSFSRHA